MIPVYNCERFLRRAAESALAQPETDEVLLIWDASPDNALAVGEALAAEHPGRVRVLKHPDGKNHGAGASRNLGICEARNEWVAFLDADDFYLPGRFAETVRVIQAHADAEGVYEAVGVHYENECAKQRWLEQGGLELTTMTQRVPPEELFEAQDPIGPYMFCQTSGWTVKKEALGRAAGFPEELRLHQDSALFAKLAAVGRMYPGNIESAVAVRGVHDDNRASAVRPAQAIFQSKLRMWCCLWEWGRSNLSVENRDLVLRGLLGYVSAQHLPASHWRLRGVAVFRQYLLLGWQCPPILGMPSYWGAILKQLRQACYVAVGRGEINE